MFLPFLEANFPQLVESYRQRYASRAFLSQAYRKRLSQLMARLRQKYRIRRDYDCDSRRTHPPVLADAEQMNLAFGR
jgi:N-formylglutamate amidohydrolase